MMYTFFGFPYFSVTRYIANDVHAFRFPVYQDSPKKLDAPVKQFVFQHLKDQEIW